MASDKAMGLVYEKPTPSDEDYCNHLVGLANIDGGYRVGEADDNMIDACHIVHQYCPKCGVML